MPRHAVNERPPGKMLSFANSRHQPRPIISYRHEDFAWSSVFEATPGGSRYLVNIPPIYQAYLKAYRHTARSVAGARASASRLMKRPDVQAARQWFYARFCREIPSEPMPRTVAGIYKRLREAGSRRADHRCFRCVGPLDD